MPNQKRAISPGVDAPSRRKSTEVKKRRDVALCHMADTPEEYRRLGLDPDAIAVWEDGLRTVTAAGSYEWWYFDAHLDDGSSLVIVFYTKNPLSPDRPLEPFVAVHLDRPGIAPLAFEIHHPEALFFASSENCDVRLGDNFIRGDLQRYQIHVEHEDAVIDVTLTGVVPSWRPETGHLLFGPHDEHFFAWLPAVPSGTTSVTLSTRGRREKLEGIGYHDHNWGDVAMNRVINHWYWGRAQAGPFSIIASYITAEHRLRRRTDPASFSSRKEVTIVVDDATKVPDSVSMKNTSTNRAPSQSPTSWSTSTPMMTIVYKVSFRRARTTIQNRKLIDDVSRSQAHPRTAGPLRRCAYLRFTGQDQWLEHFVAKQKIEDVSDPRDMGTHVLWPHALRRERMPGLPQGRRKRDDPCLTNDFADEWFTSLRRRSLGLRPTREN